MGAENVCGAGIETGLPAGNCWWGILPSGDAFGFPGKGKCGTGLGAGTDESSTGGAILTLGCEGLEIWGGGPIGTTGTWAGGGGPSGGPTDGAPKGGLRKGYGD